MTGVFPVRFFFTREHTFGYDGVDVFSIREE